MGPLGGRECRGPSARKRRGPQDDKAGARITNPGKVAHNKKGVPLSTPFSPLTFTSLASTTFVISGVRRRLNGRHHHRKNERHRNLGRCGKRLHHSRRCFQTIAAAQPAVSYSTADANKHPHCARSCSNPMHASSLSWTKCGSNSCRSRLDTTIQPLRRLHPGSPIQPSATMA